MHKKIRYQARDYYGNSNRGQMTGVIMDKLLSKGETMYLVRLDPLPLPSHNLFEMVNPLDILEIFSDQIPF